MGIRIYKSYTPGTRNRSVSDFAEITETRPEKSLTFYRHSSNGRNNRGVITIRHRGGGHKKLYRVIDFRRDKFNLVGQVLTIEYDPNRNARIALIQYEDGEKRYILQPRGLKIGDNILSGLEAPIIIGNSLPLTNIALGTEVHNVELHPGQGGQLVRAAGAVAQIVAKEGKFVTLRLPSGEVRLVLKTCWATIGQVGNLDLTNLTMGKAGRNRWLGIRPYVRGSVMNPVDHPHGGGKARAPIGHPGPLSPWGKPTLGKKTRHKNRYSDLLIVRRRKSS